MITRLKLTLKLLYFVDTLEDIVGRDEMERVAEMTKERAKGGKSIGALSMAIHDGGTPNAEQTIGTVTSPILLTSTSVTTTGKFVQELLNCLELKARVF